MNSEHQEALDALAAEQAAGILAAASSRDGLDAAAELSRAQAKWYAARATWPVIALCALLLAAGWSVYAWVVIR